MEITIKKEAQIAQTMSNLCFDSNSLLIILLKLVFRLLNEEPVRSIVEFEE